MKNFTALAVFYVVSQIFADNSCRTFSVYPQENGTECRGDQMEIWCNPNSPTCEAWTAPPPSTPICGEGDVNPSDGAPIQDNP